MTTKPYRQTHTQIDRQTDKQEMITEISVKVKDNAVENDLVYSKQDQTQSDN